MMGEVLDVEDDAFGTLVNALKKPLGEDHGGGGGRDGDGGGRDGGDDDDGFRDIARLVLDAIKDQAARQDEIISKQLSGSITQAVNQIGDLAKLVGDLAERVQAMELRLGASVDAEAR
jgi:hypothetical protein